MVLGVIPGEIINEDKPLVEHLSKGFKISQELVFLKNVKKAMIDNLKSV